jgi:hypothetical protein
VADPNRSLLTCLPSFDLFLRYLKLKRGMPQTKWIIMATGVRIGGVSLAEHIEAAVLPVYGAETTKFISGAVLICLMQLRGIEPLHALGGRMGTSPLQSLLLPCLLQIGSGLTCMSKTRAQCHSFLVFFPVVVASRCIVAETGGKKS